MNMHLGQQPLNNPLTSVFSSASFRTSVDLEAPGVFQAATEQMHNQVARTQYPDLYQSGLLFSSSMIQYSLQAPFQAYFTPAMPIYHSVNNGQSAPRPGESRMCFPLERVVAPAVKVEMPSPPYASLSPPHRGESMKSLPQSVPGNTQVDTLMKAIQAKQKPKPQQTKHISEDAKEQTRSQKKPRKYECPLQDCNKRFCQKTHLVIHMRSHTGEKPYVCRHPGCGQSFSQLGNLRTHERRHTGERPYNCDICGRSFAQRWNVREHQIVHQQIKRFTCELDECGKRFTQRGNLKHHQNRFHADTIAELTKKFTSIEEVDNATDEDRKLWEYFASMYKNLNKGIRGRGKYRRISVASSTASTASYTATMVPSARQDSMDTEIYTLSASKSRCSALPLAGFEMAAGYTGSSGYENGVFPDREPASSQSRRRSSLSLAGLIQADDGYDFKGDMARGYTASSDYKNEVFPERAA